MRDQLNSISRELYQRSFEPADAAVLREGAKMRRLAARAAETLKESDIDIVRRAVREFQNRHPEKASQHTLMWEKVYRDMRMNLRYCLQCVALNDAEHGKQVVWWWFRTILNAFDFGDGFVEEGYRILQEEVLRSMPADQARAISAMMDEMIATLCYNHAEAMTAAAEMA